MQFICRHVVFWFYTFKRLGMTSTQLAIHRYFKCTKNDFLVLERYHRGVPNRLEETKPKDN